jgi:lysylphosphatidylglycerol synthase-like protein
VQFNRYLTYHKSGAQLRVWPWLLKIVLAAASFYYVLSKLISEKLIFTGLQKLFASSEFSLMFIGVAILMVLNWLLESIKWQLIARKVQRIKLFEAIKAILAGVSLDAILPFGTGAFGSKVFSLNTDERDKLITPVILAQGIQSFWTVIFGLIGLGQLAKMTNIWSIYKGSNTIISIGILGVLLLVVVIKYWSLAIQFLMQSVQRLTYLTWIKILVISLARYLVFLSQLLLLSAFLAPKIPFGVLLGCITWMYFAKTIVPKPGHLGALGIRGASVVFFLSLGGYQSSGVVLATLLLWVINLAVPSLIGLIFIKELNLRTESK